MFRIKCYVMSDTRIINPGILRKIVITHSHMSDVRINVTNFCHHKKNTKEKHQMALQNAVAYTTNKNKTIVTKQTVSVKNAHVEKYLGSRFRPDK